MKKAACSWSGGKDCSFALLEAKSMGYDPQVLLSMIDVDLKTSRSHGLPVKMLEEQAKAMELTLLAVPTSRVEYEKNFIVALKRLQNEFDIHTIVFGDIDLMAHYEWLVRVCDTAGMEYVFPLWNRKRTEVAQGIIKSGIKSVIVASNMVMGEKYLGQIYTAELVKELAGLKVDSCGEDGEFHSFVVDGPHFAREVIIPELPHKIEDDFHFIDWGI